MRWMGVCCLLCLIGGSVTGWAAASRDLPLGDPTYRYLDTLVAAQLVRTVVYGQRPFSRLEVARMLREARKAIPTRTLSPAHEHTVTQTLEWLETEYAEELQVLQTGGANRQQIHVVPLDTATSGATGLGSPMRPVPPDNGLQPVTAQINPLVANRGGRDVTDGGQSELTTTHHAQFTHFLAIDLEPRVTARAFRNGGGALHATLRRGYVKAEAAHLELFVGRGELLFGPGSIGGPLLSANAPPLDMIRLATPRPFELPWVFRHIGRIKGTLFFADLGADYTPAHTILSGYRVDLQPWDWLTFGINHTVMMGGRGMTGPSVGSAISQFVGIAGAFAPGGGAATSNHLFGFDLHIRIPQWRGLQLYGVYAFDDPDANFDVQLNKEAAWVWGCYLPRLTNDGRWGLRAEYQMAGAGTYRHYQYTNGWALHGRPLGLPYGGDSNAGLLTAEYAVPRRPSLRTQFGIVQRSGDIYTSVGGTSNRLGIQKIVDRPDEWSSHLTAQTDIPLNTVVHLVVAAGYEHVWNVDFAQGRQRNNLLAEAGLTFRFP